MVNYHPSDELLMAFSAGQEPNALGLMVSCHVEKCASCKRRMAFYENLGGEMLAHTAPQEVKPAVLDGVLAKLDDADPQESPGAAIACPDPKLPRALWRFLPEGLNSIKWSGMSRSIKEFELPLSDEQFTAKLYKIAAGKELPEHTHRGKEFTLVMSGSFSDLAGKYNEGDFILADTTTIHQPKASIEEDCICFAVLDAPLKMTGFFGRMLNPFL